MKKWILFSFSMAVVCIAETQDYLNIMTFNIRYNNPADSLNAWPYRKEKVAQQIDFHQAHIVGIQEALHDQMQELKKLLLRYNYVGVGRDDGKAKGEYSAIFFDSTRLRILQSETFWLAEQTDQPGLKGWDAAITRIVTWAKFQDKKTKRQFFLFNTHFDHRGKIARAESAKLLLKKVNQIASHFPCIITGDFNASPGDEPIRVLIDKKLPGYFTDSKEISTTPHYGPSGTFNGFGPKEVNDDPIDYIFIKNQVKVLQHATISQTWQGRFSSDHFSVFARIEIIKER